LGDDVETVGGLVVESVHEVSVAVDRYLNRGVPEPGLDGFGVLMAKLSWKMGPVEFFV
jgi:hypothetical protein